MDDFLSAALGAFSGLVTGTALEWWKAGRGNLSSSCDTFCDLVRDAAQLGAEFWLTAGSDTDRSAILLARLAGFQKLISGYLVLIDDRLHEEAVDSIAGELGRFFAALTGDDPQDPARLPSQAAAIKVQTTAATAILTIRRGTYEHFSLKEALFRKIVHLKPSEVFPLRGFPGDSSKK